MARELLLIKHGIVASLRYWLLVVGLDKYLSDISISIRWKKQCTLPGNRPKVLNMVFILIWWPPLRETSSCAPHCTALRCAALLHRKEHEARGTGHGVQYTQSRSASILFFIDHLLSLYDRCFFESLFHRSSVIWSPGPSNSIFPRRILSDLKILPLEPPMNLDKCRVMGTRVLISVK